MEELLQRLVEQNDELINLSHTQVEVLQDLASKLDGLQSMVLIADASSEVSSILSAVQEIADKLNR